MLNRRRPSRFAILCSRRAPGLDALLDSSLHGSLFEVVLCLTSDADFAGASELRRHGVPVVRRPIREFCAARGVGLADLGARALYDAETAVLLRAAAVDWVLLDSYLFVLTSPMLTAFAGRILNIHDADLTRTEHGRPLYAGLHATRDAIMAGEKETRATVHFVTEELDAGPPLLRSWPFPILPGITSHLRRGLYDAVRHYAAAHRDWVMADAWGVLLTRTAELLADGRVDLHAGGVRIDNETGPSDVASNGELVAGVAHHPSFEAPVRGSILSTERIVS
jgi:phosphoribosylglycinamide formyltransferase-1